MLTIFILLRTSPKWHLGFRPAIQTALNFHMAWMGVSEVIYLRQSCDLTWSSMSAREKHYMRPEMLQPQLATFEEPKHAFVANVSTSLDEMIDKIVENYLSP